MPEIPSFEKLNKLVLSGLAAWGAVDVGIEFSQYINNLPWDGARPDWRKITKKVVALDFYASDDREIKEFIKSTALSRYKNVAFLYQDKTPLLITKMDYFNQDVTCFLTHPGDAMAFGFNDLENARFDDFILVFAWDAYAIAL